MASRKQKFVPGKMGGNRWRETCWVKSGKGTPGPDPGGSSGSSDIVHTEELNSDAELFLRSVFRKSLGIVRCEDYDVDYRFENDECDGENGAQTVFQVFIHSEYMQLAMNVYPLYLKMFEEGQYARLAEIILHEACHCIIDPLHDIMIEDIAPSQERRLSKVIERQTQQIRNALREILPDDWWFDASMDFIESSELGAGLGTSD